MKPSLVECSFLQHFVPSGQSPSHESPETVSPSQMPSILWSRVGGQTG